MTDESERESLQDLLVKAENDGPEALTDEELERINEESKILLHGLNEAMKLLCQAYMQLEREFVEAFGPVVELAEEIDDD